MAPPALAAEHASRHVPGEALVVIEDHAAARSAGTAEARAAARNARAAAVAASASGQVVSTFGALSEASGSRVFTLIRSETRSTEALIEALEAAPGVVAASPNRIIRASVVPNDALYKGSELWGMKRVGAEAAWDVTSGSENVCVAILDTGIQGDHPDLYENVDLTLARNFTGNLANHDTNVTDDHWHGTHVAGTIGAVGNNGIGVAGVSWRVKIIPIKILGDDGKGSLAALIAAINYVIELLRDDSDRKIAALNLSLGMYYKASPNASDPVWLAFKALDSLNRTVMVFAAGNNGIEVGLPLLYDVPDEDGEVFGKSGEYAYPASYTGLGNAIVVGAIDRSNAAAGFTNWSGGAVHLLAPGVGIYSTSVDGSYAHSNGTSMAAPHVAGAAALLAAQHPDWSAAQIKNRILETTDKSVNPASPNGSGGAASKYGLLRIDRAIRASSEDGVGGGNGGSGGSSSGGSGSEVGGGSGGGGGGCIASAGALPLLAAAFLAVRGRARAR
jgi:subtilisin family serine protease